MGLSWGSVAFRRQPFRSAFEFACTKTVASQTGCDSYQISLVVSAATVASLSPWRIPRPLWCRWIDHDRVFGNWWVAIVRVKLDPLMRWQVFSANWCSPMDSSDHFRPWRTCICVFGKPMFRVSSSLRLVSAGCILSLGSPGPISVVIFSRLSRYRWTTNRLPMTVMTMTVTRANLSKRFFPLNFVNFVNLPQSNCTVTTFLRQLSMVASHQPFALATTEWNHLRCANAAMTVPGQSNCLPTFLAVARCPIAAYYPLRPLKYAGAALRIDTDVPFPENYHRRRRNHRRCHRFSYYCPWRKNAIRLDRVPRNAPLDTFLPNWRWPQTRLRRSDGSHLIHFFDCVFPSANAKTLDRVRLTVMRANSEKWKNAINSSMKRLRWLSVHTYCSKCYVGVEETSDVFLRLLLYKWFFHIRIVHFHRIMVAMDTRFYHEITNWNWKQGLYPSFVRWLVWMFMFDSNMAKKTLTAVRWLRPIRWVLNRVVMDTFNVISFTTRLRWLRPIAMTFAQFLNFTGKRRIYF